MSTESDSVFCWVKLGVNETSDHSCSTVIYSKIKRTHDEIDELVMNLHDTVPCLQCLVLGIPDCLVSNIGHDANHVKRPLVFVCLVDFPSDKCDQFVVLSWNSISSLWLQSTVLNELLVRQHTLLAVQGQCDVAPINN